MIVIKGTIEFFDSKKWCQKIWDFFCEFALASNFSATSWGHGAGSLKKFLVQPVVWWWNLV